MSENLTYSEFRAKLKDVMDYVCNSRVPMTISRRNGDDVVVMSKDDFDGMEETIYLLSSRANASSLISGINGEGKPMTFGNLDELRRYADKV